MSSTIKVGAWLDVWHIMAGEGGIKLFKPLPAFTCLAPSLQPRLWPDEVQFGLASNTQSLASNSLSKKEQYKQEQVL